MCSIVQALRFKQVSVIEMGLLKQFFQCNDVSQVINGVYAMCMGKSYTVAQAKAGMAVYCNAEGV